MTADGVFRRAEPAALGGLSLIFFVKFVEFVVCGSYCRSGTKDFYSHHKCCLNALFPLWGIKGGEVLVPSLATADRDDKRFLVPSLHSG